MSIPENPQASTFHADLARAITECEGVDNRTFGDNEDDENTDKVATVATVVAGLEAMYEMLSNFSQYSSNYTAEHATLAKIALDHCLKPIGAVASDVVTAMESDTNETYANITITMDQLSDAIGLGNITLSEKRA